MASDLTREEVHQIRSGGGFERIREQFRLLRVSDWLVGDLCLQVLKRDIPWETYTTAKLINSTGLQLLRRYDHRPDNVQAALLEEVRIKFQNSISLSGAIESLCSARKFLSRIMKSFRGAEADL